MTMMNQEQIKERLQVMRFQEDSKYVCSDYLFSRPKSQQIADDTIDHVCRFKMTEWCYTVIDYIKFRRETVSIAMNYLDRFLATGCPRAQEVMCSRREYQLASMTTLFMAIKINEPVVVDVHLMTELSKGVYRTSDFKRMETDILFGLNWYVNGPTAHSFALHLLTLMQQRQETMLAMGVSSPSINYDELLQLASYKIELAVGEYSLMTQKPSVIATASIWSCLQELSRKSPYAMTIQQHFFEITSNFNIQMDCLQETKECLEQSKLERTMKMRSINTSLLSGHEQQPNQQKSSPRSTSSPMYSQDIPCTKDDPHHCSPICISKRNIKRSA